MSGFAKAAAVTQISPLDAKNWATADTADEIIPDNDEVADAGGQFHRYR